MIILPWPVKPLWPNRRAHRMALHRARKASMTSAFWLAKEALSLGLRVPDARPLPVLIEFRPAVVRRRDADNALSAMKGAIDGIAQAIKVDDGDWQITPRFGPRAKGGQVRVSFGAPT